MLVSIPTLSGTRNSSMTFSVSLEVLFLPFLTTKWLFSHMAAVRQIKKLFRFKQLYLTPDDYNEKRWLETVALSYLQCVLNRKIVK